MLKKHRTWKLVEKPRDQKIIGCCWTYIIKYRPKGKILCYKAHLIIQGYSQIPGLDFSNTYSLTVQLDLLQAILHLTAAHSWYHCQDNITGMFLHSKINHEIYM